MSSFLVLGTDTDVGKTAFSALWLAAFAEHYAYWKPIETGPSDSGRIRALVPAAQVFPALCSLAEPVAPEVLVATVQSLLRLRRTEAALASAVNREREAREQAEQATRLRDEFIALLSHELRTPLNAVMGWLWQLRHSALGPEARERALDSLERNARLQVQLISDLLDVSRIAKGKLLLELTRLDLGDVVAEALESVSALATKKALQIDLKGTTSTLVADFGRLQQIVINLLTNAIQFTPTGGSITLQMERVGDTAVLWVRDTGLGIDPEMLPAVFDQFQQGPGGQSRKHGGLGLGLAVVRQLTELHDGQVSVESGGRGKGTSFRLQLPRETDDVPATPERTPVLSGVRIGLALDAASDRDLLKAMLEACGAEVLPLADHHNPSADRVQVCVTDRADAHADCLAVDWPLQQARLVRRLARLEVRRPVRAGSDQRQDCQRD